MDKKIELIKIVQNHKEGIHIRELSRLLKTGMPNVLRYIRILEKEGVVKKKKDANLVKIMLKKHPMAVAYLKESNTLLFISLPQKVQTALNDFINELPAKPLIALVFGSYAKGSYQNTSDIDLFLVFQKAENPAEIENTAKRISQRTNTKISPVYVNYHEFQKNFLGKESAFYEELRQNIILLIGAEYYYPLLWRFME